MWHNTTPCRRARFLLLHALHILTYCIHIQSHIFQNNDALSIHVTLDERSIERKYYFSYMLDSNVIQKRNTSKQLGIDDGPLRERERERESACMKHSSMFCFASMCPNSNNIANKIRVNTRIESNSFGVSRKFLEFSFARKRTHTLFYCKQFV